MPHSAHCISIHNAGTRGPQRHAGPSDTSLPSLREFAAAVVYRECYQLRLRDVSYRFSYTTRVRPRVAWRSPRLQNRAGPRMLPFRPVLCQNHCAAETDHRSHTATGHRSARLGLPPTSLPRAAADQAARASHSALPERFVPGVWRVLCLLGSHSASVRTICAQRSRISSFQLPEIGASITRVYNSWSVVSRLKTRTTSATATPAGCSATNSTSSPLPNSPS